MTRRLCACLLLLVVVSQQSSLAQSVAQRVATGFLDRTITINGVLHRYQIYVPLDYDDSRAWPLVVFLHGDGQWGDDGIKPTARGLGETIRADRRKLPSLVLFPQIPVNHRFMEKEQQELVMAEITATEREFRADADRVYLFGVSNGAAGAIRMPYNWPHRFAAVVAMAPRVQFAGTPRGGEATDRADHPFANSPDPFAALAERLTGVPIYIGHGADDQTVPVEQSRTLVDALRARNADVRYHEYPTLKHVDGIDRAVGEPDLMPWLFEQRLKN